MNRCPKCLIQDDFCFCFDLDQIDIESQIHILMDKAELRFSNNTSILAYNTIDQCEIHVKGLENRALDFDFLDFKNFTPLILYPSNAAIELTKEFVNTLRKPIQLILPDGTWTQTKRFMQKQKTLNQIPRVKLSKTPKSIYQLRRQVFDEGLCTYEAIAYALGLIENKKIEKKLLDNLNIFVCRHLQARRSEGYKLRFTYENSTFL